jgi:hypothetical protein
LKAGSRLCRQAQSTRRRRAWRRSWRRRKEGPARADPNRAGARPRPQDASTGEARNHPGEGIEWARGAKRSPCTRRNSEPREAPAERQSRHSQQISVFTGGRPFGGASRHPYSFGTGNPVFRGIQRTIRASGTLKIDRQRRSGSGLFNAGENKGGRGPNDDTSGQENRAGPQRRIQQRREPLQHPALPHPSRDILHPSASRTASRRIDRGRERPQAEARRPQESPASRRASTGKERPASRQCESDPQHQDKARAADRKRPASQKPTGQSDSQP